MAYRILIFDPKVSYTAIFTEIQVDKLFVTLPARVKKPMNFKGVSSSWELSSKFHIIFILSVDREWISKLLR